MKINSSSYSSSSSFTSKKYNFIKQLNNKLEITCQLELRRVSLLLLLIVGTTFDKSCLATNIEENEGIEEFLPFSSIDESSKRAGARAFQRPNFDDLSYELKRGGARTFSKIENKRGGARTFSKIEEKRGGARPFYGFFGDGDSTWKRGGGRYFIRPFADYGGIGGGGNWAKRGGGRQFSADKRAGGRNFFGNLDSTFDSTNYWIPPRYTPLKKAIVAVDDYQILHNSPPFYSYHFN